MRPARRGSGETQQNVGAELTLPDGDRISGTRAVDRKITDILGIDKEKFTRIVMLAQGDFQKLLLASTEERIKIFRDLFKTELYDTLSKAISDEAKDLYRQMEAARNSSAQFIWEITCTEDSLHQQEVQRARKGELTDQEAADLLSLMLAEDTARQEQSEKNREKLEEDLRKLDQVMGAARNFQQIRKDLEEKEAALKAAEQRKEEALAAFSQEKKNSGTKDQLNQEIALQKEKLSSYDALDQEAAKIQDLEKNIAACTRVKDSTDQELKKKTEEKGKAEELLEQLKDVAGELAEAGAKQKDLERRQRDLEGLLKKFSAIEKDRDDLVRAQDVFRKAEKKYREAEALYSEKNHLFLAGQAGVLAETLEEGQPCPVCGSISHPSPAKRTAEIPTEKEIEKLEKAYKAASDSTAAASTGAAELKTAVDLKQTDIFAGLRELGFSEDLKEGKQKTENLLAETREELKRAKADLQELTGKKAEKEKLETSCRNLEERISQLKKTRDLAEKELASKTTALKLESDNRDQMQKGLPFSNRADAEAEIRKLEKQYSGMQKAYETAEKKQRDAEQACDSIQGEVKGLKQQLSRSEETDLTAAQAKRDELQNENKSLQEKIKDLHAVIRQNEEAFSGLRGRLSEITALEERYRMVNALSETANGQIKGHSKIRLEAYVQMVWLDRIIARANTRFMIMSNAQYELKRKVEEDHNRSQGGLDISVTDHYNGTEREVGSLSGGEKFLASLSLALGLSDEIQNTAGGVQVDTLFVDEGFGSLDTEKLDLVYRALTSLTEGHRMVGIISHVQELEDKIDHQIVVTKQKTGGSKTEIRV